MKTLSKDEMKKIVGGVVEPNGCLTFCSANSDCGSSCPSCKVAPGPEPGTGEKYCQL